MREEMRLVVLGFPLQEAICLCNSMRRSGTLEAFIQNEEAKYKDKTNEETV